MFDEIFSVSGLNDQIKEILEGSMERVWVEGEVSNVATPASGHIYFTLKDEASQIRAVVFRRAGGMRGFAIIGNGARILCRTRLNVYKPRGEYHLVVEAVELRGAGALQKLFEETKARLKSEGLFDDANKKTLPRFPRKVAVVTSPTGAVIRDILNISLRRSSSTDIVVIPTRVQGMEAAKEILNALRRAEKMDNVDAIIIARGGGSFEDLAAFNNEAIARAIFHCRIPVVSAIGHETDFTIADFVADVRASTPSAAAEIVFPDKDAILAEIEKLSQRMFRAQMLCLVSASQTLSHLQERVHTPERLIDEARMSLDERTQRIRRAVTLMLTLRRERQMSIAIRLNDLNPTRKIAFDKLWLRALNDSLMSAWGLGNERRRSSWMALLTKMESANPLTVLQKGYSIAYTIPDGKVIRDAADVAIDEKIKIKLLRGCLFARVQERTEG